jgi:hypothetical protein
MALLTAGEGEENASGAGKHERQQDEHREDGKTLRLTDKAPLVSETSGAGDGE